MSENYKDFRYLPANAILINYRERSTLVRSCITMILSMTLLTVVHLELTSGTATRYTNARIEIETSQPTRPIQPELCLLLTKEAFAVYGTHFYDQFAPSKWDTCTVILSAAADLAHLFVAST